MRTFPSSRDIQGTTYYPTRWIQVQDHIYSATPKGAKLPIMVLQANTYSMYPLHPTRSPLIHLGRD